MEDTEWEKGEERESGGRIGCWKRQERRPESQENKWKSTAPDGRRGGSISRKYQRARM